MADYPNDSIAKNGQNPETSPGSLRRFAVTQTPVKKPSANTDGKNSKGVNNNKNNDNYNNNNNPADHSIKLKEWEKKDKYIDLARELKKLWNRKVSIVPMLIGAFGTVTEGLLKNLEDLEVGGRVETIQNDSIIEDSQNTEKSPVDLRTLAVTQTPVKNHQR